MYIRYFLYRLCTSASIGQTESFTDSINGRSIRVDGISFDLILSTSWLQKFFLPPCLEFLLMCTFESSRSVVLFFVLLLSLSLSHVAHESTSLNGKIDWRRWRVTNRESRAILYAALVTKILLRFIETLFYLRISH